MIEMGHARRQKQNIIKKPLRRTSSLLRHATTANQHDIGRVTIDILPEDVLLDIFDHYVARADEYHKYEEWQMLVHVCQKWRYVVFQSPLRLNLRILCSTYTPVTKKLAIWPPLPIIIKQHNCLAFFSSRCSNNFIAALEHNDRVCAITLDIPISVLESVFASMQKTLMALKDLRLHTTCTSSTAPVVSVSDSFLGGSAPHLRHLDLAAVPLPFPVLRKLLLSAPNLVTFTLRNIPHSCYFSPEAMVTCLSAFTRLEQLYFGFMSSRSCPPRDGRHPPPTRSVLPALTRLTFGGASEYLEDLVSRIDAPLLCRLHISFFHQLIFDTPQLSQFLSRTPNLKSYNGANVIISN
jgi:hypothetical protein